MSSNTVTAPRCRIMVDGKVIARGTNVQYTAEIDYQDVEVLDNVEVDELAPVAYRVSGSIGMVKTKGVSPKSIGLIPETGVSQEKHLENILLQKDLTLVLMDKADPPKNLVTITGVKFGSYGWAVSARGIATENLSFRGIRETDESE